MLDPRVFEEAHAEIARRSRKAIYRTDFDAWSSDVLGRRYYERMRQVNAEIVERKKSRFAIKSANGCGKSLWLADWETFWVTAFPPEDSLVLATANGRQQIEAVIFKYLKDNYGYMSKLARETKSVGPVGFINESLEWKYSKPDGSGNESLVIGKRPADQDIVSSFQGTRKLRTLVGMDEAGGLPVDLYTAAEAVLTGEDSVLLAIGNPDRRGTEFHRTFTTPSLAEEWSLHTISAYDLPTMTGEIVYPNDSEKQARMMAGLTAKKWIAHKERVWKSGGTIVEEDGLRRQHDGKPDARFKAKVLGEFPSETDNSFFPEDDIDKCRENTIEVEAADTILGVDLAAMGDDESVVYVNRGGHCRVFDRKVVYDDGGEQRTTTGTWSKEDEVTSARRVHAIATYLGATEVRLDAAGLGGGIASMLERLDEFSSKQYSLIRVVGSHASTDKDRWQNSRDENHDSLKALLREGALDLDYSDEVLRDQLLAVTYALNNRGAVKITSKSDMRSEMHGSPDRLDALIYSVIDTSALTSGDNTHLAPGDRVLLDPWAMLQMARGGEGMPI